MRAANALTGGCLCGAVRYTADGTPGISAICHCQMCQRATGGPFLPVMFMASDTVQITKGKPRVYCSSETSNRHFCDQCGSPLFFERHTKSLYGIVVGSLDDPNVFRPQMHIATESAVTWLHLQDDVPRYAQKPAGMTPLADYDPVTGTTQPRLDRSPER